MDSEFFFNFKKTAIFQAVRWKGYFRLAELLKNLFLILFILIFLAFLYGFLGENFPQSLNSKLLGLLIILFTLSISLCLKINFFKSKFKNPELKTTIVQALSKPEKYNLAGFMNFEVAEAVCRSKNDLTRLFYNLLCNNPNFNFVFSRAVLSLREIKKELKKYLKKSIDVKIDIKQEVILNALKVAQRKKHQRIEKGDMITALSEYEPMFKKILIENNLTTKDVENLTWWEENLEEEIKERKKFWKWENLIKKGSLAKEWAFGYTITLDKFSIDLSKVLKKRGSPEIIGHQEEIRAIERILSKEEDNNVLLIGEPGAGKKSIVQGLAAKLLLGKSLPNLNYKKIKALNISFLLSRAENQEEIQAILDKIFQETLTADNVILTINDFDNFIKSEKQPGVIDISGIISSYLALSGFQIIAITTYQGLHKYLEKRPEILNLFEKVEVSEISERETLVLLERLALIYEQKYKKFISYQALKEIISLAAKYLPSLPFPKKAVGLLDEVMVYISQIKDKIVLPKHVAKIVSEKTQIPVGEIETKEKEILLNLEKLIHQRIINQDKAVDEISAALRRARAGITIKKGLMGGFLFLGPTGVGKTETSKALAEIYFGSEQKMIRLDMSEFQAIKDISRLIGSPQQEGLLTTQVRENPFSLILLDEIEKAHPNVLNLFLQVLDEGFLTDGLGRKINFKNSIIIATSNAGYKIILEALKEKTEWSQVKEKLLDYLFEKAIFRPEFINRFDGVIVFKPLSKENLLDIAELLLQKLKKNLKEKNVEFIITLPLKEKIVELSYSPIFGAREMKRVIQNKIENVLASALLSGKLKKGDKIEIDPEKFKLNIR